MTPDQFNAFLADYRATHGPITDGDMAQKLGIHRDTMTNLKQRGAPLNGRVYSYALAALMHNLKPYGENK